MDLIFRFSMKFRSIYSKIRIFYKDYKDISGYFIEDLEGIFEF
jgi:hypothetical protein